MVGSAAASGVAFDPSTGNICVYSLLCKRSDFGIGISGALNPVVVGIGTGNLCSGTTKSKGVFWTGGKGIVGSGALRTSSNGGVSGGRGAIGLGGGAAFGTEECTLTLMCLK